MKILEISDVYLPRVDGVPTSIAILRLETLYEEVVDERRRAPRD